MQDKRKGEGALSDKRDTIRVLFVRPGKAPEVMEMENSLSGMQRAVEGNIQMLLPFEEEGGPCL